MKKWMILGLVIMVGISVANAQNLSEIDQSKYTQLSNDGSDDVSYYADNATYKRSADGKVSASIKSFHDNGALDESGVLINGQKHGKWMKYNEAGELVSEGYYNLGQKDGIWKVWEGDVLRIHMEYNNGQRVGKWLMYDADGNVTSEKDYQ